MKEKLLHQWNFRRILYLIGGIWMIVQSVHDRMWFMILFGLYFLSMAVFRFGCASGNCNVMPEKDLKSPTKL